MANRMTLWHVLRHAEWYRTEAMEVEGLGVIVRTCGPAGASTVAQSFIPDAIIAHRWVSWRVEADEEDDTTEHVAWGQERRVVDRDLVDSYSLEYQWEHRRRLSCEWSEFIDGRWLPIHEDLPSPLVCPFGSKATP